MKNKIIIFSAILLTFLIWIPYIFPYFSNVDEPAYFLNALSVFKGNVLYRDVIENKGPIMTLICLFFIKISPENYTFLFHLTLFLLLFIESILIYKVLVKLKLKNLAIYGFFYPVFLSLFYPGNMTIGAEPFISLLLLIIFYIFLLFPNKIIPIFVIGLLSGIIVLFKPFGIFLILLLIFLIYYNSKSIKKIFLFVFASIVPLLFFSLYIFKYHISHDFLLWAIKYPVFLSRTVPTLKVCYFIFPMLGRIFLLIPFFTVFGIYEIIKKNKNREEIYIILFLIFTVLWGASHGLPFPHHYRLLFPFLFIISLKGYFNIVFSQKFQLKNLLNIFIIFSILQGFFYWNGIDFYKKWIGFLSEKKWTKEYEIKSNSEILEFLDKNTSSEDKIVIWGHNPKLYLLSKRDPGRRFKAWHDPVMGIVFYDVHKIQQFPNAEELFIFDMKRNNPKYFIDATKCSSIGIPYYSVDKYYKIYEFLLNNYKRIKELNGYVIYQNKKNVCNMWNNKK